MKVVIAEKPSVAREIAAVLGAKTKEEGCLSGNGYKVTWAFGHLIGLADAKTYGWNKWEKGSLPMIPDKFVTGPIDNDVIKQLKILSSLFKEADMIINSCDAGREGELIFRYIYEYLQKKDGIQTPFSRLWISSLTDKAIREGFDNIRPGAEFDHVAEAAKARSQADWLVGINATVATTLNVGHGTGVWSVGRVQTPTLAMICRRFIANRDFVPVPYFTLQVMADKEGKRFKANNPVQYKTKEEAEQLITRVKDAGSLQVYKIETKPSRQMPPLLYDLTTLQKEANSRFSYSADKTLEVAQSLYEKKLTTYPRTGSRYIPDDVFDLLPGLIANAEAYPRFTQAARELAGKQLARTSVNAAKVTDHHALLPTEKKPEPDEISRLTREEVNIYEMIVGRMLETVSVPCIKDVTTVVLVAPGNENVPFTAKGYIVRQAGWRGVMNLKEEKKEDDDEADLPPLVQGETLALASADVLSKQTKAPALLTENTLLGMMEVAGKELENEDEREAMKDIGLGTPATRASIIENLIKKGYVAREKKNLIPTDKGIALFNVVKDMKISNAEVTGNWERKLNQICDGKMDVNAFNTEIITYTHEITNELLNTAINTAGIRIPGGTNCPCPKCKQQNVRFSPKGYVFCPDKECKFIISTTAFGKKLDERTIITLLTQGNTKKPVKGLKSNSGKTFECVLKLSSEFRITLDLPDQGPATAFRCACPKCKSADTLQINDSKLWCSQCDFVIWRERNKHILTTGELEALCLHGEVGPFSDFVSKKGTNFSATLRMDDEFKMGMVFNETKQTPLPYICPKCGTQGTLSMDNRFIQCSAKGCGLKFWKSPYQHELTGDEIEALFTKGQTEVIKGLQGKKNMFNAALMLDDKFELTYVRNKTDGDFPSTPMNNPCPKCGQENLSRSGKSIRCSCGFELWTDKCGHTLTDKEAETLLSKKRTGLIRGLKGKSGKSFDAHLKLKADFSGKIEFEFEKK